MNFIFDVIVVGGGHAGIEACHAAAKMGASTALITLSKKTIGLMPCNPSIGGLGKGHIVYEVSALGGLMPQLASKTYLQARMLNTSKGPAVQGLRLQIDKYAYKQEAQDALDALPNLTIIEGMVTGLGMSDRDGAKAITGVSLEDGRTLQARTLVITSGTFLNGAIHIGLEQIAAGRHDEKAVHSLSESITNIMGVELGRLKTGTPPRLLKDSVDYSQLEYQESDELDYLFEFRHFDASEKIPVYIAHTNTKTHEIIHNNLHRSGMYSGNIKGVGPRYCPSIEDKISRYPNRASHHIFVEPEGACSDEVYPSGISTSLPLDVQTDYIHSIKGFENAVISKAGYAVEYDFIQPNHLKHTLETKAIKGLYFAGQVNGTTGYEEAAGQGVLAGINAALQVKKKEPFTLDRGESYIGVMVDDLITLGVDEPYRMFTSRAERRLILRQDNVFYRLSKYGHQLGLIDDDLFDTINNEQKLVQKGFDSVMKSKTKSGLYEHFQTFTFDISTRIRARSALAQAIGVVESEISSRALLSIHAQIRYDGYLQRELKEIEKTKKYQALSFDGALDFERISGLSFELQQKLKRHNPQTIAQAQLIPGMTPAAISLLIFQIRQQQK